MKTLGLFASDLSSDQAVLIVRQAADAMAPGDALRQAILVLLDERDDDHRKLAAAIDCRKHQREYFRGHSEAALRASRHAETKLDRLLKE